MSTIYIVEDDENIRELTVYALKSNGYHTIGFESYKTFNRALTEQIPNLILLDIMLPEKNGIEILGELKKSPRYCNIPVIMVTAKTTEYDKVKGLDLGADDYISKPFGLMEMISRVKAVLRRCEKPVDDIIVLKELKIDKDKRIVYVNENPVTLTYKEFELLVYLAENRGKVLTRDKILSKVWGYDFEGETRTVDVHIRTLRTKLAPADVINTIRNVGYSV